MPATEPGKARALSVVAVSQPGPTKRRNEDALLFGGKAHQGSIRIEHVLQVTEGESLVFAVSDGMAGSPNAHVGSRLLLELLDESFRKSPTSPESLRDRLLELQYTFVERGRKLKCRETAATLAGVVITGDQVHVFNVGDSRVYGIKAETIRQLSRDHTELADMIENGEIKSMTVREAPSSFLEPSSFYMADGMHAVSRVYTRSITLADAGALLICSDGLVDVLDDQEIVADLKDSVSISSLISKARSRNGTDDISVLAIRIGVHLSHN